MEPEKMGSKPPFWNTHHAKYEKLVDTDSQKVSKTLGDRLSDMTDAVTSIFKKEVEILHLGGVNTPSMVNPGEGKILHEDYFYERIAVKIGDGKVYTYGKELEPFVKEWVAETKKGTTTQNFNVWMGEKAKAEDTQKALKAAEVRYFTPEDLKKTEVAVREGKLVQVGLDSVDRELKPLQPGAHAFIITEETEITGIDEQGKQTGSKVTKFYSTPKVKTKKGKIQHSSFMSGGNVKTAGVMEIDKDGHIVSIKNQSGHYRPTPEEMALNVKYLQQAGYDTSRMHIIYPIHAIFIHIEIHLNKTIEWGFVNQRADKWFETTGKSLVDAKPLNLASTSIAPPRSLEELD
jgi:hypothetical protein